MKSKNSTGELLSPKETKPKTSTLEMACEGVAEEEKRKWGIDMSSSEPYAAYHIVLIDMTRVNKKLDNWRESSDERPSIEKIHEKIFGMQIQ